MATRKPLVLVGGVIQEVGGGDTVDPTVLPASTSAMPINIGSGVTKTIAANTQEFFHGLEVDGLLQVDGWLVNL